MQTIAQGEPVPASLLAPMTDSAYLIDQPAALQERMQQDGYLHFSAVFDSTDVLATREAVFGALATMDEITGRPSDGIFSGRSARRERAGDLGSFWRQVSECWPLRRLSHGQSLHQLTSDILGAPARVQDYVFLRPVNPGKFTHLHCDAPFFTRLTEQVVTVWIALGDVPAQLGPLFVVQDSHRDQALAERYRNFDVVHDKTHKAALDVSPQEYATRHQSVLLTRDFQAGDIVIFGMHTLHGTFDNVATDGRCRLSCDVRYQPANQPADPRYFGTNPTGTTGAGYGELVGAKPLTDDWHIR